MLRYYVMRDKGWEEVSLKPELLPVSNEEMDDIIRLAGEDETIFQQKVIIDDAIIVRRWVRYPDENGFPHA